MDGKNWKEVAETASISFGSVQLYCYPDPRGKYYFKIGSVRSKKYLTMEAAKVAGLLELEKLGQAIIDGVRGMPEYGHTIEIVLPDPVSEGPSKEKLGPWHLSILGMDSKK